MNNTPKTGTLFKDWKIDGYIATSPDGEYRLWIANGFLSFKDYDAHYPRETLLAGVSIYKQYKIWKEFCRERELRASSFLKSI